MTDTIPPVSPLARVELALRKRRAKGATCHELADELSMLEATLVQYVADLLISKKAERIGSSDRFRIIRA